MLTGVSSTCSTGCDNANRRNASYSGVSAAPARPAGLSRVRRAFPLRQCRDAADGGPGAGEDAPGLGHAGAERLHIGLLVVQAVEPDAVLCQVQRAVGALQQTVRMLRSRGEELGAGVEIRVEDRSRDAEAAGIDNDKIVTTLIQLCRKTVTK